MSFTVSLQFLFNGLANGAAVKMFLLAQFNFFLGFFGSAEWSINYLHDVVRWERASGGSLSKGTLVFAQTLLFFALSSSSYEIFQHPPPSSFAYCAHVFF